ncbi:hypothetical protein [Brevibacillus parabrevis]|uniref:hypothetical protein n=1 Tax=Brevibacillus parabrevis TaxID=54914 RepID=UPI00113DCF58|nr:hypothetical protein [Brevibacillus parabrevis]MED1721793.1 hypothetical protein [Brevibacillus parabrevis]TGV17819.1 hypothetical protein EN829_047370 [Mesorhizobium sp. M00.F.Ca.ET.186.01.1.1]
MNRLFLLLFGLMLFFSFWDFILKRKPMERKQQIVIYSIYALSVIGIYAVQYQHDKMLSTGFFLNIFAPQVKIWIEHML